MVGRWRIEKGGLRINQKVCTEGSKQTMRTTYCPPGQNNFKYIAEISMDMQALSSKGEKVLNAPEDYARD
jgi:hypothetical protein